MRCLRQSSFNKNRSFHTYLLHSQFTYLNPIVVARWRSWDFFPTTSRRGWDSNPHQESCTELGSLKDARPNERSGSVRKNELALCESRSQMLLLFHCKRSTMSVLAANISKVLSNTSYYILHQLLL